MQRKGIQRELSNLAELRVRLRVRDREVLLTRICKGKYQLEEQPREKAQRSAEGSLGVWLSTDLHRLVKSLQRPRKEPSKKSRKKENTWRNNGEYFHKFPENYHLEIQSTQQTSSRRNMEKTTLRHIKIKLLTSNDKEKIKSSQRKKSYYVQWTNKRMTSVLPSIRNKAGREQSSGIFLSKQKVSSWHSICSKSTSQKSEQNPVSQAYKSRDNSSTAHQHYKILGEKDNWYQTEIWIYTKEWKAIATSLKSIFSLSKKYLKRQLPIESKKNHHIFGHL